MNYYISKTIKGTFRETVNNITTLLKDEGYGVLTKVNVKDILNKKLDVDYKNYVILGVCNPHIAVRALQAEDKIGALLPCNVIVIDQGEGNIEITFMSAEHLLHLTGNPSLELLAREVNNSLNLVLDKL